MYINNIVFRQGSYEIERDAKKPDSALSRLQYLDQLSLQSVVQAKKIEEAAKEILKCYNVRRNTWCGRFRSLITFIMQKCLRIRDDRDVRDQSIKQIHDAILAKTELFIQSSKKPVITLYKEILTVEKFVIPPPKKTKIKVQPQNTSRPCKEMKDIQRCYLNDPLPELQRLRNLKVFDAYGEKKLDENLENFEKTKSHIEPKGNQVAVKIALGRALEIKQKLAHSHYVFTHSQDTRWVVVSYLLKELFRKDYSKEDIQRFKFLRVPSQTKRKVSEFKNKNQIDHYLRDDLVSADGFLLNDNADESALNFLTKNFSVASKGNNPDFIVAQAEKIIDQCLKDSSKAQALKSKVSDFIHHFGIVHVGTYHIICVPKKYVTSPETNFQLRTHPYGKPCDCNITRKNTIDEQVLLEALQSDHISDDLLCDEYDNAQGVRQYEKIIPQYRLLASHLIPGNGVLIMTQTPVSQSKRREIKQAFRQIIH